MVDLGRVPQPRRIDILDEIRRARAVLDHLETLTLAAIATDDDPYPGEVLANDKDWLREEVACVLRIAPVTAGAKLHTATQLVTRFPATVHAMAAGTLPGYYATRLVEATDELSDTDAGKVEERTLPRAATQTVSQYSAVLRRAVLSVDPRTADQRHTRARAERRIVLNPAHGDGMCSWWALLPADQSAELAAKIDTLAASWTGLDQRTADQRRADALCALAIPGNAGIRGNSADTAPPTGLVPRTINVTVALSTLLDLDDHPALLEGNPITAALTRALAYDPTSRWRRLLTDPCGNLVHAASSTYAPPAPLHRLIELRDQTCQFPTCTRHASHCDLDHVLPWSRGGPTRASNLHCLCPRHHHLKHRAGWPVTRTPDGTDIWTDPGGHTYQRPPPELPSG